MKKIILFEFIMILSIIGFSQSIERNSKELFDVSELLSELNDINHWKYSYDGQWKHKKSKDLLSSDKQIESLELREVKVENENYIIFIKKYRGSHYEYPTIKSGFYTSRDLEYFIFPKKQIIKILPEETAFNTAYFVKIDTRMNGKIYSYENNNISKEISSSINSRFIKECFSKDQHDNYNIFLFPVIYEGEKKMRFFIESYNFNYNKKTIKNFDKEYYEVDFDDFKEFFK